MSTYKLKHEQLLAVKERGPLQSVQLTFKSNKKF